MSDEDRDRQDLTDVTLVWGARQEIVSAVGELAARPLDERAVAGMRAALDRASKPTVRAALRRLSQMVLEADMRTVFPAQPRSRGDLVMLSGGAS